MEDRTGHVIDMAEEEKEEESETEQTESAVA